MTPVVRTAALTKVFSGGLVAVDHVDLEVREGDLFGFLGPNGAGKTTTIRMLLGLIHPSSGDIELLGRHAPGGLAAALRGVGTLVEGPAFYPYLSGERNLQIFDAAGADGARRTRRTRVREVVERVGLAHVGRKPVKAYSLGMRQRLGLAAALMRQPRLLILDEPTNGLDAQGIHELRTMFVDLVAGGTTIMLSSHLLAEVQLICTRTAMMSGGRIVVQGDVTDLLSSTGWARAVTTDIALAERLLDEDGISSTRAGPAELRVQLDDRSSELLVRRLVDGGVRLRELVIERRTLEDVFLERTGGGAMR